MPTRAPDRGSATIYAALLAGLLTALAGAALAFGAAVLARHRAGAAADLAALSAAIHAEGGQAPCDWARRVAAAQRARLVRCTCDGPVCLVGAAVGTPWGAATVTSRAGPDDDSVGSDAIAAGVPGAARMPGADVSASVGTRVERVLGPEAEPTRLCAARVTTTRAPP